MAASRMPILERLRLRSEYQAGPRSAEIGDCLVWLGRSDSKGYGRLHEGLAHRLAWIARHGDPPLETPCVLHHCDNPPCWRDEHLFLGTNADNIADRDAKGRQWNQRKTHCPKGHEYDVVYSGARGCRTCKRRQNAEGKARARVPLHD